jgi:hypothetical protein
MAQTKRKRQTKHRGNAAGVVESRGRTGRKPTVAEKRDGVAAKGKGAPRKRGDRFDDPPTWRGAFFRALAAAVLMVAVSLFLFAKKNPAEAFLIFPVALGAYTPISYYSDMWAYNRRKREKAKQAGGTP